MRLFSRHRFVALTQFFSRLPGFSKPDKHSLHFLNIAQFMGVLNDNIFKLVIAFLLIGIYGQQEASTILSVAGAIFVIPFLLFSSAAGVLADRFSKQRLLIWMKFAEILIMSLAVVAFATKSVWGSYTLLFLLSTHSALFGPSKYAIISDLVSSDRVSRANGLITSFTYLGVIIGTFLASFLTEWTDKNFVFVALFCLGVACVGFISTFGIKYTNPQGSDKKIEILFIKEIFKTLSFCKTKPHLLISTCGSSYFLFIGSFVQLNVIPFAIDALHFNEVAGGYLFLSTALGIAFGSYLAGKVSRVRVELGVSCIAGILIGTVLLLLGLLSHSLLSVITLLVLLGVFGGFFIVPFDSFIQIFSPSEKRGQVIAATNFLSFCGVLLASLTLYVYSQFLEVSPAEGFGITGFITILFSLFMICRLSDLSFPFIAKYCLKPFFWLKIHNVDLFEKHSHIVLVLRKASWLKTLLLLSLAPKTHLVLSQKETPLFRWINRLFFSIHVIPSDPSLEPLLDKSKELVSDTIHPCIWLKTNTVPASFEKTSSPTSFFKFNSIHMVYVDIAFGFPTVVSFSKKATLDAKFSKEF
jgi:acyl-[acyl-carrier-protein]-phospholipid O-acyltransferase/long-chain-fatty-acid--[acyl-carrier-protein] ligase